MAMLLLVSLSLAAPAAPPKPPAPPENLDGHWKLVRDESGGRSRPAAKYASGLVIVGNEYTYRDNAGTLTLDSAKHTLDMKVTAGGDKDGVVLALYELKGDTLKIAMSPYPTFSPMPMRPEKLETDDKTRHTLCTFERDRKPSPEIVAQVLKQRQMRAATQPPSQRKLDLESKKKEETKKKEEDMAAQLRKTNERVDALEKRIKELENKK